MGSKCKTVTEALPSLSLTQTAQTPLKRLSSSSAVGRLTFLFLLPAPGRRVLPPAVRGLCGFCPAPCPRRPWPWPNAPLSTVGATFRAGNAPATPLGRSGFFRATGPPRSCSGPRRPFCKRCAVALPRSAGSFDALEQCPLGQSGVAQGAEVEIAAPGEQGKSGRSAHLHVADVQQAPR